MCLAIPARVLELSADEAGRALVEVAGVRRRIDTGLLQDDPPNVGDWVLVHVGFAMSKISEEQALDQLRTLSMLGEEAAVLEEAQGYGISDSDTLRDASPRGQDEGGA
jgi:hydrogenase expression/formation protein HypC